MKRLREWFDGLAERERKLVLVFAGLLLASMLLAVPFLSSRVLDSRREEIDEFRSAISSVQNARDKIADRQLKRGVITARYARPAPPLGGFIESAAKAAAVTIPESQDLSEVKHGKNFVERSTQVRLRKVGMLALVRMMEKIENSGFPVVISKLHVRKRGGETDSYDVEMNVSAFDHTAPPAKASATGEDKPETSHGKAESSAHTGGGGSR